MFCERGSKKILPVAVVGAGEIGQVPGRWKEGLSHCLTDVFRDLGLRIQTAQIL